MFFRICTSILSILLIFSITVPGALFVYPKKVQAQEISCIAQVAVMFGASQAVLKVLGVTTSDPVTQVAAGGTFVQNCIIKPLVVKLAKAMLYNITVSTVNWINSGFKGNPSFVQDLRGVFSDAADDVIGEFLAKEAGFLCQPFSFQVRIALAQSYLPYRQRAACTLTDIKRNVNGFIDNNNSGGWDQWLQVTTVPQNNAYGAFVIAQDEISKRIVDAQAINTKYLDWGKGFRDFEVCESQAEANYRFREDATGEVANDYQAKPQCTKTTPGSVIERRLGDTLSIDLQQLAVADSINAILDALANQVTKQIFTGAQGLLGGKRASKGSYGSVNYETVMDSRTKDVYLENIINENIDESNTEIKSIVNTDSGTTTEPETPPEPKTPTISWVVVNNATPVFYGSPYFYDINLVANHSTSTITVTIALKKDSAPIKFLDVFEPGAEVTYGRTDGSKATYKFGAADPGVEFSRVAIEEGVAYNLHFTGYRKITPGRGNIYTIETTARDSDGRLIETKASNFVIQ